MSDGVGAYESLSPFEALPDPLTGPVEYVPDLVPPDGTGILNAEDGFCTVFGVIGGVKEGLAVGG